jgi:hypothetical protein
LSEYTIWRQTCTTLRYNLTLKFGWYWHKGENLTLIAAMGFNSSQTCTVFTNVPHPTLQTNNKFATLKTWQQNLLVVVERSETLK